MRSSVSIVTKMVDGACHAQRLSDGSGETYWIEVGITAFTVHGRFGERSYTERVGFNEIADSTDNLLVGAIDLLRATIRSDVGVQ